MDTTTHPDHPGVKIPPPLIYLLGVVLGAWLDRRFPLFTYPERPARIAAILCGFLWVVFSLSAIGLFFRARTSLIPIRPAKTLVTAGVYRISRNPMYIGLVFLYVGLTLWFGLGWPFLLLPFVVALIQVSAIAPEERYLRRRFGQTYLDYQASVRRWL